MVLVYRKLTVISFLDQPDTIQMRELLVVVLKCSLGLQS